MSKKLYGAIMPLLAVAAFLGTAAAAQAAPHWYSEGTRLPFTSAKTQDVTWGKLKLTASTGLVLECKVVDAGNVWNTTLAAAGRDNLEVFQAYECHSVPESTCASVTVTTNKLPYESELTEAVAGTIRDKFTVAELVVVCGTNPAVVFSGTLEPKVVNGSSAAKPTVLEFGTGSGTLTASGGVTATVEGKDRLVGFENSEVLTAKNP
jgi:hypothetical protein